ncbi:PAS domain-containing sensor histidine kinase [Ancylomarina sp. YFZ004]
MTTLKENELTFQLMVEASPNALLLINSQGKIVYLNHFAETLFKYSKQELIGQDIIKLIPERFKKKHSDLFKTHVQNPLNRQMDANKDLYGLKNGGEEFPVEIGLNPIVTVEGILVLASIIDITERKKANDRFRLVVESAPNAIILVGQDGKISLVNKQTENLFGYAREELMGQDVEILLPDKLRAAHPQLRNMFLKAPQPRAMGAGRDLYARRKNGSEFPIEIGLNPIETANGDQVLASIIDITERKKANDRFRLVVESAPNAIILVGQDGKISLVNKQTENLFGYAREELMGQDVEILLPDKLRAAHPQLRNMFLKAPQPRAMGAGRDLYARRKDGSEFPIEIGLNPIETANGDQVLASIIDISERKKIENALQLNTKKIEEKNKELEQFTYIASHDLQEPLNTIISFVELIKEHSEDKLNEIEENSFQFIHQASTRMKSLIKGLLDYSRLGKKAESKKTNLNLLVESVCYDLDYLIQTSNAKIVLGELPTIYAYETELRLLFQNLISNAIKFMDDDKTPEIHIHAEKEKSAWRFSVKDNGIGIDSKYQDKVFIIFQRLHTRTEYEGTGIGLAHCRKIVELHNGDIWVDSEVGKGSTFNFTINTNIKSHEEI